MSDFEVGKPLDFSNPRFDLPPVTEKSTGFITGDDEAEATDDSVSEGTHPDTGQDSGAGSQDTGGASGDPMAQWHSYRGQLSHKGVPFDPSVHQCPPSETKAGYWRKKSKAQRKAHGLEDDAGQPNESAQAEGSNATYRQQAQNAATVYAQLHGIIYGEGARVDKPEEITPLIDAYEAYIQQVGGIPVSPGWGAILQSGMYTQSVATKERNIEKTRKVVTKIGGVLRRVGVKLKLMNPKREQKTEKEGDNNARPDYWEQRQRQDEFSQTSGIAGQPAQ